MFLILAVYLLGDMNGEVSVCTLPPSGVLRAKIANLAVRYFV
jgi:hypothetical protein